MKYILRLFIYFLLFVVVGIQGSAQDKNIFSFRRISPAGGFTYGAVNSIGEDANGFIWFGTIHGLYRYNTVQVDKFIHNPDDSTTIPVNNIRTIFCDKAGRLWIGTSAGLCYYDNAKDIFVTLTLKGSSGEVPGNDIRKIFAGRDNLIYILSSTMLGSLDITNLQFREIEVEKGSDEPFSTGSFDASGRIWIGGDSGTVWLNDKPETRFRKFCKNRPESISRIYPDEKGVWIGYNWAGLDFNLYDGSISAHYGGDLEDNNRIQHNRVRDIFKDESGRLWISTYKGITIIDNGIIKNLTTQELSGIPYTSIYNLFRDSKNGLWVGTWSGGLAYMSEFDNKFIHIEIDQATPVSDNEFVSSFAEKNDGTILIGTEFGNLNRLDRSRNCMVPVNLRTAGSGRIENIKSLLFDRKTETLWIGTFLTGLWCQKKNDPLARPVNIINDGRLSIYALEVSDSGLWIGSFGRGLFHYNTVSERIKLFDYDQADSNSITSNSIRALITDSDKSLWIGTNNGLNHFDPKTGRFKRYVSQTTKGNSLSSSEILALMEDSRGDIWIGTAGGGLNRFSRKNNSFSVYHSKSGLIGDDVYGIREDSNGTIWISSENGISSIDPVSEKIRNFYRANELSGNMFNPGAGFITGRGEILFGGTKGFIMFEAGNMKTNLFPPEVVFTGLAVNNVPVDIHSEGSPLKNTIQSEKQLKLVHSQNSLTFSFVATNFLLPEKNRFRYRLVNYDNRWVEAGPQNYATYTKIPPGHYTFEVLACNNDGLWNETPSRLSISVSPPPWLSFYAYILYGILILSAIYFILRFVKERQRFKKELLLERLLHESEGEIHKMKMQFFTNISHEFRTPLTLIVSPINQLLVKFSPDPQVKERLHIIQRNAQRLLQLVNQLIDIHKIEAGKAVCRPQKTDLVNLIKNVISYFETEARDKNIQLSFIPEAELLNVMIDQEMADKIFFNILANAIKFTGENGNIAVTIYTNHSDEVVNEDFKIGENISGNMVCIEFSDNGPGIPHDELKIIFERFGQGKQHQASGTGIGLHMAYEYTSLHKGYISVKSIPGVGSRFTVNLPYTSEHELNAGPVDSTGGIAIQVNKEAEEEEGIHLSEKEKNLTILIIEDNYELRNYLKTLLNKDYRIVTAPNGKQGLETALTIIPDLIVTDVMMPQMDGFEVCSHVKNDIRTSHVPVILLTALYEPEKQIGGFRTGADAYITKPFDENIFMARVENLIKSRAKLREIFSVSDSEWANGMELLHSDRMLIEKASHFIDQHLNDRTLVIDTLASALGMSISTMYRKIKVLTNQSPTEFIRYIRLKKAVKLMDEGNTNVDEIGFAVGFNSHSYFTSSFKKQFGMTPSEYLADLR
jgi:signal transduction histidine kinase/ligand-binding sensor domain-containing protein/AraC-like DNA-binding protein